MIKEQISLKAALKRALQTLRGERVLRPDYGLSLSHIDKNLTPLELMDLRYEILNLIRQYFPQLVVQKIAFSYAETRLVVNIDTDQGQIAI